MIEEIEIRDLGVIAEAVLPIGPGFTAITGETGAGKTMVVTALGLLLGQRGESGIVRSGAPNAVVQGRWLVDDDSAAALRAREAGAELDPVGDRVELIMGRTVSAEGRSRATVGGRSAPVGVLHDIGDSLVAQHGQSDQLRLRSESAQRAAVDRFGGDSLLAIRDRYRTAYRERMRLREERDEIAGDRDRRRREADELRAALEEIEAADPADGEDAELLARIERLSNVDELRTGAGIARQALSGDSDEEQPDAVTAIEAARRALERPADHDDDLAGIARQLDSLAILAAEISADLSHYLSALDDDGVHDLPALQERRAVLTALERKYGPTLSDVLRLRESGGLRLLELDGDDERLAALDEQIRVADENATALAAELSTARRAAATELAERVGEELHALAMPDAALVVDVEPAAELGSSGADIVTIRLRPHAGSEPRPLGKGASGGELSRVMLAIEVVVAGADAVHTFIFDEVDAGVGGSSAIEIGRRLARLAERAQVIVVTHLAQVAAFATNHLSVVKGTDGHVTASSVRTLQGEERVEEMARLLSGLSDSDTGLAHARELLHIAAEPNAAPRRAV